MRNRLVLVPPAGAALPRNATFRNEIASRPVPTEAAAGATFDRALAGHVAAARTARAEAVRDSLGRLPVRRLALSAIALFALFLYSFVLQRLGWPSISPWAMTAVFVAASVSSIAGFAFSAICGAMLFHLLDDPVKAVQIMMVCSLGGQALMTWSLRDAISWRTLAVFGLGAAVGLPIGLHILLHTPAALFTRAIGGLIVLYAAWMIVRRPIVIARQHATYDALAGLLGGITGGAAAFPGAFVTIWCGLKGWSKERQRGVYQPFILLVQLAAIAFMAVPGLRLDDGRGFDFAGVAYLPAMLGGCALGMGVFRRLNDRQFARGANAFLLISGVSLLV